MRQIPCPCCDCRLEPNLASDTWHCEMCDYTWTGLVLQELSLASVLKGTNKMPPLIEGAALDKAITAQKKYEWNQHSVKVPLYHLAGDRRT